MASRTVSGFLTYSRCADLLGRRDRCKIANNTYLTSSTIRNGEPRFAVELHGAPILHYLPSGLVFMDSCDYRSRTTKSRLSEYGPVRLTQSGGKWFVGGLVGGPHLFADGFHIMFNDKRLECRNVPVLYSLFALGAARPAPMRPSWLPPQPLAWDCADLFASLLVAGKIRRDDPLTEQMAEQGDCAPLFDYLTDLA